MGVGFPDQEVAWHASLPSPTRTPPTLSKEYILRMWSSIGDILEAGMLLIDVRRTDYEGGTIRGSLNMPAQSFYLNQRALYRLCKGDGSNVISRVIFYCGSSSGRGPRCAGWFADYIAEQQEKEGIPESMHEPKVFTLQGGIKGWVNGGPEYQHFMDAFEPEYWAQFAPRDVDPNAVANVQPGEKRTVDAPAREEYEVEEFRKVASGSPSKKRKEEINC